MSCHLQLLHLASSPKKKNVLLADRNSIITPKKSNNDSQVAPNIQSIVNIFQLLKKYLL